MKQTKSTTLKSMARVILLSLVIFAVAIVATCTAGEVYANDTLCNQAGGCGPSANSSNQQQSNTLSNTYAPTSSNVYPFTINQGQTLPTHDTVTTSMGQCSRDTLETTLGGGKTWLGNSDSVNGQHYTNTPSSYSVGAGLKYTKLLGNGSDNCEVQQELLIHQQKVRNIKQKHEFCFTMIKTLAQVGLQPDQSFYELHPEATECDWYMTQYRKNPLQFYNAFGFKHGQQVIQVQDVATSNIHLKPVRSTRGLPVRDNLIVNNGGNHSQRSISDSTSHVIDRSSGGDVNVDGNASSSDISHRNELGRDQGNHNQLVGSSVVPVTSLAAASDEPNEQSEEKEWRIYISQESCGDCAAERATEIRNIITEAGIIEGIESSTLAVQNRPSQQYEGVHYLSVVGFDSEQDASNVAWWLRTQRGIPYIMVKVDN